MYDLFVLYVQLLPLMRCILFKTKLEAEVLRKKNAERSRSPQSK